MDNRATASGPVISIARPLIRRRALVIVEDSAEPRTPTNRADGTGRRRSRDQCVRNPLVIPLVMIVRDVFGDRASEMALADWNQLIEVVMSHS
jgi:hypothetical protein